MISLALHLAILLLLLFWRSTPEPVESFIVIDVGTPAFSEVVTDAATVGDPAPLAPQPQVADPETGDPQARAADDELAISPDDAAVTQQPAPSLPEADACADRARHSSSGGPTR